MPSIGNWISADGTAGAAGTAGAVACILPGSIPSPGRDDNRGSADTRPRWRHNSRVTPPLDPPVAVGADNPDFTHLGEILEAFFVILLRGRREGINRVPDRGAGETVDHGGEIILAIAVGLGIEKRAGRLGRGLRLPDRRQLP